MRKPLISDFDQGDGNEPDYEAYVEQMDNYADSERDRELEEQWEKEDRDHERETNEDKD